MTTHDILHADPSPTVASLVVLPVVDNDASRWLVTSYAGEVLACFCSGVRPTVTDVVLLSTVAVAFDELFVLEDCKLHAMTR